MHLRNLTAAAEARRARHFALLAAALLLAAKCLL